MDRLSEISASSPESYLFHYTAIVKSQYDGDTWTLDIDLGFGVWLRSQKVRLYGINTPELRGDERERGLEALAAVRLWCPTGTHVTIVTYKDRSGKYGRWLATVFQKGFVKSVNQRLIDAGLAVEYYG